jgi:hypothetical protein
VHQNRLAILKERFRLDIDLGIAAKTSPLRGSQRKARAAAPVVKGWVLPPHLRGQRVDFEESLCFRGHIHPLHTLRRKTGDCQGTVREPRMKLNANANMRLHTSSRNKMHEMSCSTHLQPLAHAVNHICDVKARECEVRLHVIVHTRQNQWPHHVWETGFRQARAERVARRQRPVAEVLNKMN